MSNDGWAATQFDYNAIERAGHEPLHIAGPIAGVVGSTVWWCNRCGAVMTNQGGTHWFRAPRESLSRPWSCETA